MIKIFPPNKLASHLSIHIHHSIFNVDIIMYQKIFSLNWHRQKNLDSSHHNVAIERAAHFHSTLDYRFILESIFPADTESGLTQI